MGDQPIEPVTVGSACIGDVIQVAGATLLFLDIPVRPLVDILSLNHNSGDGWESMGNEALKYPLSFAGKTFSTTFELALAMSADEISLPRNELVAISGASDKFSRQFPDLAAKKKRFDKNEPELFRHMTRRAEPTKVKAKVMVLRAGIYPMFSSLEAGRIYDDLTLPSKWSNLVHLSLPVADGVDANIGDVEVGFLLSRGEDGQLSGRMLQLGQMESIVNNSNFEDEETGMIVRVTHMFYVPSVRTRNCSFLIAMVTPDPPAEDAVEADSKDDFDSSVRTLAAGSPVDAKDCSVAPLARKRLRRVVAEEEEELENGGEPNFEESKGSPAAAAERQEDAGEETPRRRRRGDGPIPDFDPMARLPDEEEEKEVKRKKKNKKRKRDKPNAHSSSEESEGDHPLAHSSSEEDEEDEVVDFDAITDAQVLEEIRKDHEEEDQENREMEVNHSEAVQEDEDVIPDDEGPSIDVDDDERSSDDDEARKPKRKRKTKKAAEKKKKQDKPLPPPKKQQKKPLDGKDAPAKSEEENKTFKVSDSKLRALKSKQKNQQNVQKLSGQVGFCPFTPSRHYNSNQVASDHEVLRYFEERNENNAILSRSLESYIVAKDIEHALAVLFTLWNSPIHFSLETIKLQSGPVATLDTMMRIFFRSRLVHPNLVTLHLCLVIARESAHGWSLISDVAYDLAKDMVVQACSAKVCERLKAMAEAGIDEKQIDISSLSTAEDRKSMALIAAMQHFVSTSIVDDLSLTPLERKRFQLHVGLYYHRFLHPGEDAKQIYLASLEERWNSEEPVSVSAGNLVIRPDSFRPLNLCRLLFSSFPGLVKIVQNSFPNLKKTAVAISHRNNNARTKVVTPEESESEVKSVSKPRKELGIASFGFNTEFSLLDCFNYIATQWVDVLNASSVQSFQWNTEAGNPNPTSHANLAENLFKVARTILVDHMPPLCRGFARDLESPNTLAVMLEALSSLSSTIQLTDGERQRKQQKDIEVYSDGELKHVAIASFDMLENEPWDELVCSRLSRSISTSSIESQGNSSPPATTPTTTTSTRWNLQQSVALNNFLRERDELAHKAEIENLLRNSNCDLSEDRKWDASDKVQTLAQEYLKSRVIQIGVPTTQIIVRPPTVQSRPPMCWARDSEPVCLSPFFLSRIIDLHKDRKIAGHGSFDGQMFHFMLPENSGWAVSSFSKHTLNNHYNGSGVKYFSQSCDEDDIEASPPNEVAEAFRSLVIEASKPCTLTFERKELKYSPQDDIVTLDSTDYPSTDPSLTLHAHTLVGSASTVCKDYMFAGTSCLVVNLAKIIAVKMPGIFSLDEIGNVGRIAVAICSSRAEVCQLIYCMMKVAFETMVGLNSVLLNMPGVWTANRPEVLGSVLFDSKFKDTTMISGRVLGFLVQMGIFRYIHNNKSFELSKAMNVHRLIGLCGVMASQTRTTSILNVDNFLADDMDRIRDNKKNVIHGLLPLAERLIQLAHGFGHGVHLDSDAWNATTTVSRQWIKENLPYLPSFSIVSSNVSPAVTVACALIFRPCDVLVPDVTASNYILQPGVPPSILHGMAIRLFQLFRYSQGFPVFPCVNNLGICPPLPPVTRMHVSHLQVPYKTAKFFRVAKKLPIHQLLLQREEGTNGGIYVAPAGSIPAILTSLCDSPGNLIIVPDSQIVGPWMFACFGRPNARIIHEQFVLNGDRIAVSNNTFPGESAISSSHMTVIAETRLKKAIESGAFPTTSWNRIVAVWSEEQPARYPFEVFSKLHALRRWLVLPTEFKSCPDLSHVSLWTRSRLPDSSIVGGGVANSGTIKHNLTMDVHRILHEEVDLESDVLEVPQSSMSDYIRDHCAKQDVRLVRVFTHLSSITPVAGWFADAEFSPLFKCLSGLPFSKEFGSCPVEFAKFPRTYGLFYEALRLIEQYCNVQNPEKFWNTYQTQGKSIALKQLASMDLAAKERWAAAGWIRVGNASEFPGHIFGDLKSDKLKRALLIMTIGVPSNGWINGSANFFFQMKVMDRNTVSQAIARHAGANKSRNDKAFDETWQTLTLRLADFPVKWILSPPFLARDGLLIVLTDSALGGILRRYVTDPRVLVVTDPRLLPDEYDFVVLLMNRVAQEDTIHRYNLEISKVLRL